MSPDSSRTEWTGSPFVQLPPKSERLSQQNESEQRLRLECTHGVFWRLTVQYRSRRLSQWNATLEGSRPCGRLRLKRTFRHPGFGPLFWQGGQTASADSADFEQNSSIPGKRTKHWSLGNSPQRGKLPVSTCSNLCEGNSLFSLDLDVFDEEKIVVLSLAGRNTRRVDFLNCGFSCEDS